MKTRHLIEVPIAYNNYVNAVKDENLATALKKSLKQFEKITCTISSKKADYSYGEGKWTIKELLQHVIDAERVFVYRALTFCRNDKTVLPGFDENTWAENSYATEKDWDDMIEEFVMLRASTISFFTALNEDQLLRAGTANGNHMNVVGLAFVCAGHLQHHINIIKERYLPSLKRKKKLQKISKSLQVVGSTDLPGTSNNADPMLKPVDLHNNDQ